MLRRGVLTAALAAALLAAVPLHAQDEDPAEKAAARRARAMLSQTEGLTPFLGTIEEARAEAVARNVPLLVHTMVDTEVNSVAYLSTIVGDSALASRCERAVVVIGCDGDHPKVTLTDRVDGEDVSRTACSVLPWFETCEAHAKSRDHVWVAYHVAGGEMRAPHTIIELAEGGISYRNDTGACPPVHPVISALAEAQETSGRGMTIAEHAEAVDRRQRGLAAIEAGEWGAAFGHLRRARALAQRGVLARQIAEEFALAADKLDSAIDGWLPRLSGETAVEAYGELASVEQHVAGTKWEKPVRKALDAAERDPDLAEAVAPLARVREAEQLWRKYATLAADDKKRRAQSVLRKLLAPKYADTPAGKRAAEAAKAKPKPRR